VADLHSPLSQQLTSVGSRKEFILSWDSFVRYVLDITAEAYGKMRDESHLRSDYEEELLSSILAEDYIEAVANNRPQALQLRVHVEVRVRTPDMRHGDKPTPIRKSRKIDIQLYGSWDPEYRRRYFAWECKKIADRSTNRGLISEYVTEGVFRFCDSEYSAGLSDAGMLGYVIAGDVAEIVERINESMTSPRRRRILPDDEKLSLRPSIGAVRHVYESRHQRNTDSSIIHLYHLFLIFNWVDLKTELDPNH